MRFFLKNQNSFITFIFISLGVWGLYHYGLKNIFLSLWTYYIVWVIFQPCWWHFSLWHWGLIKTNKYVHSFHLFLYCFFFPFKPSAPMKVHLTHHRVFNTDADRNTYKVNQGKLKHLLGLTNPPIRKNYIGRLEKISIPNVSFWKWCESYHLYIFYTFNIILFLLFPNYYIFCHAIPYVIGRAELVVKIHDIVWHYKPNINFKNKPLMFLLSFSDAWHEDHHASPMILNFGPGVYKWINPQFWYFCLIDKNVRQNCLINYRNHKIYASKFS